MKKRKFLGCLAALMMTLHASAQDWTLGGNTINGNEWFGADGGSTVPLQIRHNANQPIDWYTDAIQRMRLYPTQTTNLPLLGGGSVAVPQNGFLGISGTPGFFTPAGYGPFTRLHLADEDPGNFGYVFYNQPWGYRSWMKNGVTFTGNRDQGYVGQRYYAEDETDFVIQWSDNPEKQAFGPDRMRFLFTRRNTSATAGANSQEGLEFVRMYPVNSTLGFVGVGNYAQPGLAEPEPTERLDLLDRTMRLRDFADATLYRRDNLTRVLVADAADGRVYWKPESQITAGGGAADCDWTVQNASTSGPAVPHHVFTASGSSDACPDRDDMVGIGAPPSAAKLHVQVNRATDQAPPRGLQVELLPAANDVAQGGNIRVGGASAAGSASHVGLTSATYNGTAFNKGLVGNALRDQAVSYSGENYGLEGISQVSAGTMTSDAAGLHADAVVGANATVQNNHGIFTKATGGANAFGIKAWASGAATNYGGFFDVWDTGTGVTNYGVFAKAPNSSPHWAGYFVGRTHCTLGDWTSSDEGLKTNIQPLSGGLEKLMAIAPRSYQYNAAEYSFLGFDDTPQLGFIAQELEQVLPELVTVVRHPMQVGADGAVLNPALEFKAIRYDGLIPVLAAAIQEQQAQLEQLREQLAACCNRPTGSDHRMAPASGTSAPDELLLGQERLLRIAPNPFTDRTTLHYTTERDGRVQLLANSADGRDLRILSEARREAGAYQFEWSTQDLAPGVYYVTLLLDGEPVVKRAVKVGR